MVTLTQENIALLTTIIDTATLAGIDDIAIMEDIIKGMDNDHNVVIVSDLPTDYDIADVGLGRLSILANRLSMLREQAKFEVSAEYKTNGNNSEFIKTLNMKGGGIKMSYQCQNPHLINAPKKIKDTYLFTIQLSKEDVNTLVKGSKAMGSGSDYIIFEYDGKKMSFEIGDVSGDVFTYSTNVTVTPHKDNAKQDVKTFKTTYNVNKLLPLMRAACTENDMTFTVGKKGMLHLNINGLDVYTTPQS